MATIGEKIRQSRKKKGLTQEQLATALSVSTQAVSRWETNATMPDITMIPTLAYLLGVRTDDLFDYDARHIEMKIKETLDKANEWFFRDMDKCEAMLTKALETWPGNLSVMTALLDLWEYKLDKCETVEEALAEKAQTMAEQIITDTTDPFASCAAQNFLIYLHLKKGEYEHACRKTKELPVMWPYMLQDRMRTAAYKLTGADRLGQDKDGEQGATIWKLVEIQELFIACGQEGKGFYEIGEYEKAVQSFTQAIGVLEIFLKEKEIRYESYLWNGMQTHHWAYHLEKAGALAGLNRMEEAQDNIRRAYFILTYSWKSETDDYFANNPEYYLGEFRRIYGEYTLDTVLSLETLLDGTE